MRSVGLALTLLLLTSPIAFAGPHDGGEGLYGETNDKVVTNAGFLIIAAIPAFIFLMSLLQFFLDKRKARRKRAQKTAASAFPGGW
jgi:hypothetical protein